MPRLTSILTWHLCEITRGPPPLITLALFFWDVLRHFISFLTDPVKPGLLYKHLSQWLINWLTRSSFVEVFSRHCPSKTGRAHLMGPTPSSFFYFLQNLKKLGLLCQSMPTLQNMAYFSILTHTFKIYLRFYTIFFKNIIDI